MNERDYEHLVIGRRYRIAREFVDFDRVRYPAGDTFTFLGHDSSPHDDGHTFLVAFDDSRRSIRMQDERGEQGAILADLAHYFVPA